MTLQILQLPLGPVQTNCYIAADTATQEAVVIDPGWSAAQIMGALDERQWQLRAVLLTHAHFDHIGGVADLLEARPVPLALHPLDLPLLRANGGAAGFGLHIRPCPTPDVTLEAGQTLTYGALQFEVLFVPGHTPGHVAFYHAGGAVFSGDVLFQDGIGRTDFPGSDYATLMRSINEVLLKLPDETTVCSGHGPVTTIGVERQHNPFLAP